MMTKLTPGEKKPVKQNNMYMDGVTQKAEE